MRVGSEAYISSQRNGCLGSRYLLSPSIAASSPNRWLVDLLLSLPLVNLRITARKKRPNEGQVMYRKGSQIKR